MIHKIGGCRLLREDFLEAPEARCAAELQQALDQDLLLHDAVDGIFQHGCGLARVRTAGNQALTSARVTGSQFMVLPCIPSIDERPNMPLSDLM